MIVYFDEFKLRQLFGGTPRALQSRALDEAEDNLQERGIVFTGNGNGYVVADISRARPQDVIAWLFEWAACVNLQRGDVMALMGRSIDALVLVRGFDNYPAHVTAKLSRLTPDEIIDACRRVSYELQAQANQTSEDDPMRAAFAEQAEADLVNAGMLGEDEGAGRSLERRPEPDHVPSAEFRDSDAEELARYMDPFYQTGGRF